MESQTTLKKSLSIVFVAVGYFLMSQLGFFWLVDGANVTPLWPAAGIGIAALFSLGWRVWPGVFIGSFLSAILHLVASQKLSFGVSFLGGFMIATGTALEALAIWYLAGRFKVRSTLFDEVGSIFKFVPITLLTCLVSSSIGAVAISAMGINAPQTEPITFITWWLAEALAIIVFTRWTMCWWPVVPLRKDKWLELGAAFMSLLAICAIVFGEPADLGIALSRPSFVGPVLLWLAFRFHKRELLSGVALFTVIAIYATTHQSGPFASSSAIESFLALQLFCAMVAVTMLVLSATVRQNAEYQRVLKEANAMLETKVLERTKELEKKARILEAINSQLVVEARERHAAEKRLREKEKTHDS